NEGTLLLNKTNKAGVFAISGVVKDTLTVGDNLGGPDADVARLGNSGQFNPNTTAIVGNESGLLDLNNFDTTIGNPNDPTINLTMAGGDVTTGTGTLTLGQDISVQVPPTPRTATISGFLNLGGSSPGINRTFNVPRDPALNGGNGPELAINAVISQP